MRAIKITAVFIACLMGGFLLGEVALRMIEHVVGPVERVRAVEQRIEELELRVSTIEERMNHER